MPHVICGLVPNMPYALRTTGSRVHRALLPHIPLALHALVIHVSPMSYMFLMSSLLVLVTYLPCALHTLVPPNTSRAVHDHVPDKLLCLTCFLYLVPYILHLSTSTFLFLFSHGSNDFSEFISNS